MLDETLETVREYYLKRLRRVIRDAEPQFTVYAERAYRSEDGEYATAGVLDTSTRTDVMFIQNGTVVRAGMVDTEGIPYFRTTDLIWKKNLKVRLAPFQWNQCHLRLIEGPGEPDWTLIREWFLRWFERQEAGPDGLHGCVHLILDPEELNGDYVVEVDFGSAPVDAFHELLDAVMATGFQTVSIGY